MLKKLDKKFIYICCAIIVLPILLILFLMMIRGCSGTMSYESYEEKMLSAAKKYVKKKDILPISEGGEVEVSLDELVDDGYIKSVEKALDDTSCNGYVKVKNNGASVEENEGGFYYYTPYLLCDDYKTTYLIDKLTEEIVTSESGLYATDNGYVYKGKKVDNYVKLGDKIYRIISIDNNGILKLVKVDQEKNRVIWDQKYNSEKERIYGKNDYSDSNMIEILHERYNRFSDDVKEHLVAYNVCYGNRNLEYKNVDKLQECSATLENQFVSLLNTYDYAMASYDPECTSIDDGSCRNYNYLYESIDTTWLMNGNADNTYEVYYYDQGYIETSKANSNKKYNIVIYINGNELYNKGDGTQDNPYIIK